MWSRILTTALIVGLLCPLGASARAEAAPPDRIPLPAGFQPEGIAAGPGPVAFLGSRATGQIYRADLTTGEGKIINKGPGTPSLGMKVKGNRLYVAGGRAGDARVLDTESGEVLQSFKLTTKTAFINDVIVAGDGAWFTDSTNQALYRTPLEGSGPVKTLPLSGDIVYREGFNGNGIAVAPDGRSLILMQSNAGKIFKVDPETGVGKAIDLHGETLTAGDGILADGRTLYAVQNALNSVAVIELNEDATEGRVTKKLTDPRFDVPTTVAKAGDMLYLPNARFSTPPTPQTPYDIIAIKP
ncbi:superoxide dismutase [Actinomadura spongiicola]|uniref:Superoxide dismutase n=1 Tax=Actinomadura spongiicola TaxID=2303421 RepID=A0A372GCJ2_9ACTN|nr:SMP-30/gluconolactonase/LRE family protein [Actinomadura spongiicola]RFS82803.1 superoxide dismutase [Actinomadura spongiicola]